ncbi:BgTH12-02159, partial [Blumeria graminis f. sp. triticale]
SELPSFKTTLRLYPPHSLVTIQAAKHPTHSLLYSDISLCYAIVIIKSLKYGEFHVYKELEL